MIVGVVGMFQMGPEETLIFFGATHLIAVLALWGETMAGPFDGQTAWRERFHIDENARHRLGKAVMRAGVSLPMFVLYGLAPRPGSLDTFAVMSTHASCPYHQHGVALAGIGGAAVVVGALAVLSMVTYSLGRARTR